MVLTESSVVSFATFTSPLFSSVAFPAKLSAFPFAQSKQTLPQSITPTCVNLLRAIKVSFKYF